jgi:L-amino acid N-acyltransferase YncA
MDLSIRLGTPDDAAAIVAILNPIIETRRYTVLDEPFTADAERQFIASMSPRAFIHVAVRQSDGRIVGFQVLDAYATYTKAFDHVGVLGTFVDLEMRRQGIARELFTATFERARTRGFEKIFTFVRADNPAALETYLAHGFRRIGTASRQARIDGRYVDEILIEKLLDSEPARS